MDSGLRDISSSSVSSTPSSPTGQQIQCPQHRSVVRWLVHLRPQGRSRGNARSGLFPHQRENMGQFERTLIIADEGSSIHYVEGCTTPTYSTDSCTLLWSNSWPWTEQKSGTRPFRTGPRTSTTSTKRGVAHANATVEWVDGNIGSKLTMKYPAVILKGEGAHAEIISVAYAGEGQHQDAGSKVHTSRHARPPTSCRSRSRRRQPLYLPWHVAGAPEGGGAEGGL